VNGNWFGGLSKNVKSFSYTFHLATDEPRKITFQDYVQAKSWHREWYPKGISYTGAARVLVSLRGKARFRGFQVNHDRILIHFALKDLPSKVAAGNGIAGTWCGFFSTGMTEGLIELDAKRLTPISIQYDDRRELYSEYFSIGAGRYVPQRIQILSQSMAFDFRFRVLKPNMWIFDRSVDQQAKGNDDPIAWISDVTINGEPAVRLLDGDGAKR